MTITINMKISSGF